MIAIYNNAQTQDNSSSVGASKGGVGWMKSSSALDYNTYGNSNKLLRNSRLLKILSSIFILLFSVEYCIATDCKLTAWEEVSLEMLLKDPDRYHLRQIEVGGFASLGFEHSILCTRPTSLLENYDENKCIHIGQSADPIKKSEKYYKNLRESLEGRQVIVNGTFKRTKIELKESEKVDFWRLNLDSMDDVCSTKLVSENN